MVPDEVSRAFGPDDIGSPTGSGVAPRRLCIVARDPLLSGVFIAALTTALSPRDELEIIVDRRRAGPPTDQSSIERRHRPHVVHALERDGFALVPTPSTQAAEPSNLNLPRVLGASPIERLALKEADERKLERILEFKRRRHVRRWLILAWLMNAILVLLVLSPVVKTRMSRARPAAPPSSIVAPVPPVAETPLPKPAPPVAETPSSNPAVRALPRASRESPEAEGRREDTTLPRGAPGPSAVAPPRALPGPSAVAPPPKGMAFKTTSPQVAWPQVDVVRNRTPTSEGGDEAYGVRLADTAGRPLAGAEVSLLIRMADGTLLDVPLGSGPELGTYHVTIPALQPAPVDLRIRVVTSDRRVEIPLRP